MTSKDKKKIVATSKKKVSKKKVAKKKTAKKAAAKRVAKKSSTTKSVKSTDNKNAKKTAVFSDEEKRMMIAMHAYYKWEKAGFPNGEDYKHWLEAEQEVMAMLK